ncbi:unnamed protein product, partial [Ascophyllum nodosum]
MFRRMLVFVCVCVCVVITCSRFGIARYSRPVLLVVSRAGKVYLFFTYSPVFNGAIEGGVSFLSLRNNDRREISREGRCRPEGALIPTRTQKRIGSRQEICGGGWGADELPLCFGARYVERLVDHNNNETLFCFLLPCVGDYCSR